MAEKFGVANESIQNLISLGRSSCLRKTVLGSLGVNYRGWPYLASHIPRDLN